ncbi:hypothetical protein HanXRQr2_Chr07g0307971 [Helianthus annuus]|uniref:Uncharacterized protein n=1 Tax=Helianthus annuus TaxID=4232 RepID=A0A9K3IND5_HELAN|nr:hypothetical protein HanXRQr2_Chr07g0307971 [Helianthus annuus]
MPMITRTFDERQDILYSKPLTTLTPSIATDIAEDSSMSENWRLLLHIVRIMLSL